MAPAALLRCVNSGQRRSRRLPAMKYRRAADQIAGGETFTWPMSLYVHCVERPHGEQHRIGHHAFDAKYGIDMLAIAEKLAKLSPFFGFADI